MKKGLVFILGVLTGIILTIVFAVIYIFSQSDPESDPRITHFDTPTHYTAADKFKVFQVLPTGALANSKRHSYSSERYGDPIVFFPSKGQNTFSDDQIIKVPSNGKAIQTGTFRYSSNSGERVVPVIEIQLDGNSHSEEISEQAEEAKTDGKITYAEKPSNFTASNKFKVYEVLEHGVIAKCRDKSYNTVDIYDDPLIYIPANGQNMYYSDQIFGIPAGKKAVQVGTIKIKDSYPRDVLPIIEFR